MCVCECVCVCVCVCVINNTKQWIFKLYNNNHVFGPVTCTREQYLCCNPCVQLFEFCGLIWSFVRNKWFDGLAWKEPFLVIELFVSFCLFVVWFHNLIILFPTCLEALLICSLIRKGIYTNALIYLYVYVLQFCIYLFMYLFVCLFVCLFQPSMFCIGCRVKRVPFGSFLVVDIHSISGLKKNTFWWLRQCMWIIKKNKHIKTSLGKIKSKQLTP